jgi:hypothetical protein
LYGNISEETFPISSNSRPPNPLSDIMDSNRYLNDILDFPLGLTSTSTAAAAALIDTLHSKEKDDETNEQEREEEGEQEQEQEQQLPKNMMPNPNPSIGTSADIQHQFQNFILQEQSSLNSSMSSILEGHSLWQTPEENNNTITSSSQKLSDYPPSSRNDQDSRGQQILAENSLDNEPPTLDYHRNLNSINMSLDSNVNHENHVNVTRQSVGTGYNYDISPFNSNPGLSAAQQTLFNSGTMSMASFFYSNGSGSGSGNQNLIFNNNNTSILSNRGLDNQQQYLQSHQNPYRDYSYRQNSASTMNMNMNMKNLSEKDPTTNFETPSTSLVFQSQQDFQYQSNTIEAIDIHSYEKLGIEKQQSSQTNKSSPRSLQTREMTADSSKTYSQSISNPFLSISSPYNNPNKRDLFQMQMQVPMQLESEDTVGKNIFTAINSNDFQRQLSNPTMRLEQNTKSSSSSSSSSYLPSTEVDIPDRPHFKKHRSNSMNSSLDCNDSIDSMSLTQSIISSRSKYKCSHCGAEKRKHKCLVKEMLFKKEIGCQVDACLTIAKEPTTPAPPFKIVAVRKSCPVEQMVHSLGFELPPRIPTCLPEILQSAASFEDPIGTSYTTSTLKQNRRDVIDSSSHFSSNTSSDDFFSQQYLPFTEEQRQQLAYEEEQKRQLQLLLEAHLANLSFQNHDEDQNQHS